uniref:p0648C09.25 protein n=1 Tax=Oryza sativa subsp. japonica TaxID=39947 RepID=Q8RYX5_ORYSJ|nr:P0648C09.25 [Oryza sativa Japonica Group]
MRALGEEEEEKGYGGEAMWLQAQNCEGKRVIRCTDDAAGHATCREDLAGRPRHPQGRTLPAGRATHWGGPHRPGKPRAWEDLVGQWLCMGRISLVGCGVAGRQEGWGDRNLAVASPLLADASSDLAIAASSAPELSTSMVLVSVRFKAAGMVGAEASHLIVGASSNLVGAAFPPSPILCRLIPTLPSSNLATASSPFSAPPPPWPPHPRPPLLRPCRHLLSSLPAVLRVAVRLMATSTVLGSAAKLLAASAALGS